MKSESRGRQGLAEVTRVVSGLAGLEPGLLTPNTCPSSSRSSPSLSPKADITRHSLCSKPRARGFARVFPFAQHGHWSPVSVVRGPTSVLLNTSIAGRRPTLPPAGATAPAVLAGSARS